ncbi:MAG TPA: toll/interleukin-1 receptor domain-containing protein [Polyangia bacterium]|nr:toll/interleukin-1 receptor domain-containing protein [Polyangia bacterium]
MTIDAGHLFLSHNHQDKEFVRQLAVDLRDRGVKVWLDEWQLRIGDSLVGRVSSGIQEAGYLAVVLSRSSVTSPWVALELNAALAEELRRKSVFVLPILLEDCEVPVFVRDKMYADFRRSYSDGLNAILQKVLPSEGLPPKMIFDGPKDDPSFMSWAVHYSDRTEQAPVSLENDSDGLTRIVFETSAEHSVGVNKSVPTLHGRVSYEYRVAATSTLGAHIYLAMIPVQETGYDRTGVIEVGTNVANDPRNAKSPHRLRTVVPRAHQQDCAWHLGTMDFDFRETPTAFYSIFAARVNEGIDDRGSARVELRRVQVYSW